MEAICFRAITRENSHQATLISRDWSEISVDPCVMCIVLVWSGIGSSCNAAMIDHWWSRDNRPFTPRVTEVVSLKQSVQELQSQFHSPGLSLCPRLIIDLCTNSQAGELRAFACPLVCNKIIPWNMLWRPGMVQVQSIRIHTHMPEREDANFTLN